MSKKHGRNNVVYLDDYRTPANKRRKTRKKVPDKGISTGKQTGTVITNPPYSMKSKGGKKNPAKRNKKNNKGKGGKK